ncbi:MAG: PDZ domain-containing protein [Candidatus Ratteibacteria bacterium]
MFKKFMRPFIFLLFFLINSIFFYSYSEENELKINGAKQVEETFSETEENVEIDEILYSSLGLKVKKLEKKGFLIEEVKLDSPVEKAGFKKGDVILKIDNIQYTKKESLLKKLFYEKIKSPRAILIIRDTEEKIIVWPPLDTTSVKEDERKKIISFDISGKEKIKNGDFLFAVKDFEKALDVSINYDEREKIYYQIFLSYYFYLKNLYQTILFTLNKVKGLTENVENMQEIIWNSKFYEEFILKNKNSFGEIKLKELKDIYRDFLDFKKEYFYVSKKAEDAKYFASLELIRKNLSYMPEDLIKDIFDNFLINFTNFQNFRKKEDIQNIENLKVMWDKKIEDEIQKMKSKLDIYQNLIEELLYLSDFQKYLKVKVYSYWDGQPSLRRICGRKFSIPENEPQQRIVEVFGKYLSESPSSFYIPSCEVSLNNNGKYDFEGEVVIILLNPNKNIIERKGIPFIIEKGERKVLFIQFTSVPTENIVELKCVFEGLGRIAPQYKFLLKDWNMYVYIRDKFSNEVDFGEYFINP